MAYGKTNDFEQDSEPIRFACKLSCYWQREECVPGELGRGEEARVNNKHSGAYFNSLG